MTIISCPNCHAEYEVDNDIIGKKVECAACHTKFLANDSPSVLVLQSRASASKFCLNRKWIVALTVIGVILLIQALTLIAIFSRSGAAENTPVQTAGSNPAQMETPSELLLKYTELGETAYVEALLKQNPTLDVDRPRGKNGGTCLYGACARGYVDIARLLLRRKANPNDNGHQNGWSPITAAAANGYLDVVKLLLSSGVDIESRDHNGKTALCAAVLNNKLDVVRFLCESDARVNIQEEKGWTPLTTAASDSGTIDSVKTLVKYGKDIDLEMKNGYNDTALLTASRNDKPDIVRFLCESGAKVNIQGEKGWTPLTAAASRGTIDSVKALVKYGKGIDLEMKNGSNNTALFVAVINEKPDVVRFLCESGANVNIFGAYNNAWTPLTYAAHNGLTEIVKILVQYGKDIDLDMKAHDYSMSTPLKLASEKHYDDIVKILKENILPENGEYKVGDYTWLYSGCSGSVTIKGVTPKTGKIVIPSKIGRYPVTSIGKEAFKFCEGMTHVTIPNSVTSIEESAFWLCKGITSVTLPTSVTNIGNSAFSCCMGLTSITIPSSVTSIEKNAFSGCGHLASITIPSSVTSIGERAFSGCGHLASITIPNSVTNIGKYAFKKTAIKNISMPKNVKSIGCGAFEECGSLTHVTIPDSVTTIEGFTFAGCSNLTNVTIPKSVTRIGISAFNSCSGLKSITIPNSVTNIDSLAFANCHNLSSITIDRGAVNIYKDAFKDCCKLADNGFIIIGGALCSYTGSDKNITIPKSVTTIQDGAFSSCEDLTSITMPNSVTNIGEKAFSYCSCLTQINVGNGNPAYKSVNGLLLSKDGSVLVKGINANAKIPNSVTSIGKYAFYSCKNLTSIILPNSLTNIGENAFSYTAITNITIPNSVTSIGARAFYDCSNLTSVTIPDSVTSIGEWAFFGSTNLKGLTISEGVTSIGAYAFHSCMWLKNIKIPDSVTDIGKEAFGNCARLGAISMPEAFADITTSVFSGCPCLTINMRKVSVLNKGKSLEYYRKAAENDNVRAQYYLGMCYLEGKNIREAMRWLRMAAEKGHAGAQFELGYCYYMFSSEVDNTVNAMQWWRRAASQGHGDARIYLQGLPADITSGRSIKFTKSLNN